VGWDATWLDPAPVVVDAALLDAIAEASPDGSWVIMVPDASAETSADGSVTDAGPPEGSDDGAIDAGQDGDASEQ
jgi:hypothetical protein